MEMFNILFMIAFAHEIAAGREDADPEYIPNDWTAYLYMKHEIRVSDLVDEIILDVNEFSHWPELQVYRKIYPLNIYSKE